MTMSRSRCGRASKERPVRPLALAALLAALPLAAYSAVASKEDGHHLIEICDYREDRPPADAEARHTMAYEIGFCRGFILGVAEGLMDRDQGYCEPEGVAYRDLERAVITYLRAIPDRLTEHRRVLVVEALIATHPCPK